MSILLHVFVELICWLTPIISYKSEEILIPKFLLSDFIEK
jgi:hypothetical protein